MRFTLIFGLALNVGEGLDEVKKIASLTAGSRITRVWVSYSLRGRDPFEAASIAAEANRDLRIGIGALSPYIYTADEIRNKMLELVDRYGERFDLCLGLGDRRVLEDLGRRVSHRDFLTLLISTLRALKSSLPRRSVKIWLGAQGSRTLALTEHFDGVLLNHCSPAAVDWALAKIGRAKELKRIGVSAPSYIYEDFESNMFFCIRKAALKILVGASRSLVRELSLEADYQRAISILRSLPQEWYEAEIVSDDLVKSLTITMQASEVPNYISSIKGLGVTEVVFGYPLSVSSDHVGILKSTLDKLP